MSIAFAPATTTAADYAFHDAAAIFDLLEGAAFDELVDDVRAHGLKLPIILHDGKIIDGRNRYRACRIAGVEPRFTNWSSGGSPSDFVWSLNNHRRHLDGNARALAAGRYASTQQAESFARQRANLKKGTVKSPSSPNGDVGKTVPARKQAADKFQLPERTVDRALKVVKGGSPELQKAVAADKISISAAAQIAAMPPEKQAEIVASADPVASMKAETAKVKAFREALPKPSDAKKIAKANGGVVLASDGKFHSGSTAEQKRVHDAFMAVFSGLLDLTEKAPKHEDVLAGCPDRLATEDLLARCQDAGAYLNTLGKLLQKALNNG